MKDKNKKLLILVGVLMLTFGTSLAFFIARTTLSGTGGKVTATTVRLENSTLTVEGTLEFNDTDVYPGHTVVSAIKVTATGNNELIPYNLVWNGTNGISGLNYKVYKTTSNINVTSSCEKKMKVEGGIQQYFEECDITNLDQLGTELTNGAIVKDDTKVILAEDEFITATNTGAEVYYYVLLEYPNLDINQNADKEATFNGEVTVEQSNKQPDINILAVKVEQEDGTYKEQKEIPTSGYILNTTESTCTNGATPTWKDTGLLVSNYTKTGTSCNLTFDIATPSKITLAKLNITNINSGIPNFKNVATTDEGIFKTEDGMYGENSYYWRGAATTNHVIFADKCWRIVRINGDGSIRLIYNGSVLEGNKCTGNGSYAGSLAKTGISYNTSHDNSSYVGWTYNVGSQRTLAGTESNIKKEAESWFNTNITGTNASKVADGKFCNDRDTKNNETWRATGSTQYYAVYARINGGTKMPSLACNSGDVYTLKVGAITADEVQFAGASWTTNNTSYYLYNGQYYWTMSPRSWENGNAGIFYVNRDNGGIGSASVNLTRGLRPVINLKFDTTFNVGSDGTQDNPYIVQ